MLHWWKLRGLLIDGGVVEGYVLTDNSNDFELKQKGNNYIVSIYERPSTCCIPKSWHILTTQLAYYTGQYICKEGDK